MLERLATVVFVAALLSSCSGSDSGDEVARSGNGPTAGTSEVGEENATEASEAAESAAPTTSAMLNVKGDLQVPDGDQGELSIVVVGTPKSGDDSVPVIVRNRTAEPLANIDVTGTARDAAGSLIGSGSSQGFAPDLVLPGEWTVGYVYFDSGKLKPDTEYDLTATGSEPDEFMNAVDVEVVEVSQTKGQFGEQLVGIVENPTDAEVGGPIDVMVACFGKAGELLYTTSGFVEGDSLPPGGTSSFSVDLFDGACENWAVGSSGYNF